MRNTFSEFLRLSQQSPRPHAATYFGSLLTQKGVRNPFGSLTPLSVLFNATIMSLSFYFVNSFLLFFFVLKMSTLNSTFFHVFIVLPFCTIRNLFYCIFSLLGSAIVRLPLLPASHAPYFHSYASCFTSSSNSSPAE